MTLEQERLKWLLIENRTARVQILEKLISTGMTPRQADELLFKFADSQTELMKFYGP